MNNEDLDAFIPCEVCITRQACKSVGACEVFMSFIHLVLTAVECKNSRREDVIYDTM